VKKTTKQFCQDILDFDLKGKGLISVLLSLGSEIGAKSPTELSKSSFFQYHYSIISKITGELSENLDLYDYLKDNYHCKAEANEFRKKMWLQCMSVVPEKKIYKTQSDFTTCRKPASNCLSARGYVQIPNNKIGGNQPIDIGYYYSYVNLGLYDEEHPNAWSNPLDNIRVGLGDDGLKVAADQLLGLMDCADLPFKEAERVINSSDSGYANPSYIYPLVSKCTNLNLVIRLRAGMKVYRPYEDEQCKNGSPKRYEDEPYYLQYEREREYRHPKTKEFFIKPQTPIFDLETACPETSVDETYEFETKTRKGRALIIQLSRWNNLLLRGTKEYKMSDYPFDLIAVSCVDKETGELVFKRPMFLSFWGENRETYDIKDIHNDYRHRYDIEGHNRFSKQALLMDKYQTPEVSHLDAWMWVVQLTYWLLYAASDEVDIHMNEWEKYLPEVKRAKESTAPKSIAMTRRGAKALFSTFDLDAFKPKSTKNGKGRKKDQKMNKRRWKRPQKKGQIKLTNEQME
jgi:hypothetical protein